MPVPGSTIPATTPFVTASQRSKTSVKQRWPWPSASASSAASLLRWRTSAAGSIDFTRRDRAELFALIDDALASSAALQRDRLSGQVSLFDQHTHAATAARRQPIKSWSEHEKLSYEKELLGFYVSGHPLDAYA